MRTRKCLPAAPVWTDPFAYVDFQDGETEPEVSNRASPARRATKPGKRLPPPKTHR
mgnify:CR=1 FL=1